MKEINIKSIEELVKILNDLPNYYIFRGHSNATWNLISTIERLLINNWSTQNVEKVEGFTLNEFKSKFHLYDKSNKIPDTKLEWLSLMQHYGVPTRLIDFSTSPCVALYFAMEDVDPNKNEDMAIFSIDYRNLIKTSIDYIKSKDKTFKYDYIETQFKQDEIFKDIIDRFSYEILWVTEPNKVNLRLDRQSGCFLLSVCIDKTIQSLLSSKLYEHVDFIKIIIPINFYKNLFALLEKINLNSKVIYGDLSGLAKSIKMKNLVYNL